MLLRKGTSLLGKKMYVKIRLAGKALSHAEQCATHVGGEEGAECLAQHPTSGRVTENT